MKALLPAAFLEAIFFSSRAAAIFPVTYKVDSISPSISYDPPLCGEESTTVDGKRFCAPNQARNAWNSSFLNTVQRPHELDTDVFPSCTWATYQDGMSAPTASLSFVGRYVAVVGSSSCSKSDTAHGLIELEVDAKVVDKCVADGGRTVRCGHAVAYGRHTFTVRLVSGSFAIDRFEVSTGNKEEGQPISVSLASGAEENDELKLGGVYNVTVSSSAEWKASSRPMEQSGNGQKHWACAVSSSQGATLSLDVPKGISRLSILGAVGVDYGRFAVNITPPSFGLATFLGNAFNVQSAQGISLYSTVLDSSVAHKVAVTHMGPNGADLDICQVEFYQTKLDGRMSGGVAAVKISNVTPTVAPSNIPQFYVHQDETRAGARLMARTTVYCPPKMEASQTAASTSQRSPPNVLVLRAPQEASGGYRPSIEYLDTPRHESAAGAGRPDGSGRGASGASDGAYTSGAAGASGASGAGDGAGASGAGGGDYASGAAGASGASGAGDGAGASGAGGGVYASGAAGASGASGAGDGAYASGAGGGAGASGASGSGGAAGASGASGAEGSLAFPTGSGASGGFASGSYTAEHIHSAWSAISTGGAATSGGMSYGFGFSSTSKSGQRAPSSKARGPANTQSDRTSTSGSLSSTSSKLGGGAIAGIAVVCLVAGVAGGILGWILYQRHQKRLHNDQTEMGPEGDDGIHRYGCNIRSGVAAILEWMLYRLREQELRDRQVDLMESDPVDLVDHTIEPYLDHELLPGGAGTSADPPTPPPKGATPGLASSSPSAASKSHDNSLTPSLMVQNPDSGTHIPGVRAIVVEDKPPVTVEHVHHTDGGALPQAAVTKAAVVVEETPPTYNPDWVGSSPPDARPPGASRSAGAALKSEIFDPASFASSSAHPGATSFVHDEKSQPLL